VKTLGGEPRFFPELNKYKILFDEGEIDIWARAPMLKEGHRRELRRTVTGPRTGERQRGP
jgi:hypothetical protein